MIKALIGTTTIMILFGGFFRLTENRDVISRAIRENQEETGTMIGKVELRSLPAMVRHERSGGYRNNAMGHEADGQMEKLSEQRNVVVYLDGGRLDTYHSTTESPRPSMDQRQARFTPHILAIQKGAVVDFTNHDKVYHNVFSLSPTKKFNIGRRPTGEAVPVQFDKSGVVQIFCDIHSQMTAFVVVLENPFFVQPSDDGTFRIEHVPPGTYTIKAWHERLSAPDQKITITAGTTTTANFVLE